jgi:hypothetical protein
MQTVWLIERETNWANGTVSRTLLPNVYAFESRAKNMCAQHNSSSAQSTTLTGLVRSYRYSVVSAVLDERVM